MIKIAPYDSAEFLRTPQEIQHYMDEALETGDPILIAYALDTVARVNYRLIKEAEKKEGTQR